MKPPLAPFRPTLHSLAQEAAEKAAATLYALDHVRELAMQAALAGHGSVRITQEGTADLQDTEAAVKLIAWAAKEKLPLDWSPRPVTLPDGRSAWVREPVLTWRVVGQL